MSDFNFHGTEWNTYSEASVLKTWRQNKLVGGLNFNTDKFTEDTSIYSDSFNYSYSIVSAFVQDTWMMNSAWILQTGFRADKHNRYGVYLLPRISLLYKATKHLSLRGGYGRGYNIPTTLNSVSGQDNFQNVYPLPDDVIPEIAGSWNADILYKSRLSEEWNISFDQSFYFTTIHHPVISDPDSLVAGKYYFVNASLPIKAKGFETNIQLASDNLEFLIGYAHLDVRKKYDSLQPILELTPKNKFFFSGIYELEDNFRCGVELDYIDRQDLNDGACPRQTVIKYRAPGGGYF
jgi:outer membrane receptor for ferrienterochelin and colicins